jgi:hypothetical protein
MKVDTDLLRQITHTQRYILDDIVENPGFISRCEAAGKRANISAVFPYELWPLGALRFRKLFGILLQIIMI